MDNVSSIVKQLKREHSRLTRELDVVSAVLRLFGKSSRRQPTARRLLEEKE